MAARLRTSPFLRVRSTFPRLRDLEPRALEVATGTSVILDGAKGTLRLSPSADEVERIRQHQARHEARRREDIAHAREPATTSDGKQGIEVFANIGGLKDAEAVIELGGEGVGLLRSEFLFMVRSNAPSEDEQAASLLLDRRALGPASPVIIRTLDVGGDKPLAYLPIPREDNPFLGERGVRVGLDRPEVLRTQLARASRLFRGEAVVMFPMIATLGELRNVTPCSPRRPPLSASRRFGAVSWSRCPRSPLWRERSPPRPTSSPSAPTISRNTRSRWIVAIPTPRRSRRPESRGVAAHRTDRTARTRIRDGWHLRRHRRRSAAVPILIGLGVDELSVSLPAIPTVKAQIRRLSLATCRELAQRALPARRPRTCARWFRIGKLTMLNFKNAFSLLQKIGKCMMLPVSVLPVAGILLGVGSANFTLLPEAVSQVMAESGDAIFANLPLLFAIGVAIGLTENDGVAALAGTIGYVVFLATMGVFAKLRGIETTRSWGFRRSRPASSAGSPPGSSPRGLSIVFTKSGSRPISASSPASAPCPSSRRSRSFWSARC